MAKQKLDFHDSQNHYNVNRVICSKQKRTRGMIKRSKVERDFSFLLVVEIASYWNVVKGWNLFEMNTNLMQLVKWIWICYCFIFLLCYQKKEIFTWCRKFHQLINSLRPHGDDIDLGQLREWLDSWWHQGITWTNVDSFHGFQLRYSHMMIWRYQLMKQDWIFIYCFKQPPDFPGTNESCISPFNIDIFIATWKCNYSKVYGSPGSNTYPRCIGTLH